MPERTIDTGFWNDRFVQPKSFNAKGFYLYSWTNEHCNQAGFYEITLVTISWETGLDEAQILAALDELYPKVVWYPDKDLLWVRPFVKRQSRSPKFLIAAGKCLEKINDKRLVEDYLQYYRDTYNLEIPYRYPIDTLSIPSTRAEDQKDAGSGAGSYSLSLKDKGESEGEKTEKPQDPKLAAISVVYEQNIGILTPIVAEKLKWICDTFPEGWFQAAVKEALDHNARSLAYITSILERWSREGFKSKKNEKPGQGKAREKKIPEGLKINE